MFDFRKDIIEYNDFEKNMIYVEWLDHYSGDHGWNDIEKIIENHEKYPDLPCKTSGFLIYEDKLCVKIALTVNNCKELSTIFTVLKSAITKRIDFEI